ncbi:MAG: hypothetical protein DBY09_02675 [Selenomonadales bacterium]|nr:MAG: hypothetical protein DBY09_02675 [Selenomonadales bacterium]
MTHKAQAQAQKGKVENTMKAGKITAKLRDAVPVCFMEDGEEVKRYQNIEIPDSLKELEMLDFRFNVQWTGRSPLKSTSRKACCRRFSQSLAPG